MDQTKSTVYWLVGGSKDGRISKQEFLHIKWHIYCPNFFVKTYSLVLKEKETFVKEALYKFSYALTLQSWFCCCRDGRRW